uniref:C2H2-type domain-containing protein n=1 Tax=Periophthalmus magnuspinnatus TaxID=409849 RepID=A0A3B3ZDV8_9GOBI
PPHPYIPVRKERFSLRMHTKTHMKISQTWDSTISCVACGTTTANRESLQEHLDTHHFPCACVLCQQPLGSLAELHTHQHKHRRLQPNHCHICNKTFQSYTYLQVHIRGHRGEKPFACLTCGRRFLQKAALQTHQRTHSGHKAYECDRCGKSFSYQRSLRDHKYKCVNRNCCPGKDVTTHRTAWE